MESMTLEPLDSFESNYKKFEENASELFDELTKLAGTDVEANKKTIEELKKYQEELKGIENRRNKFNSLKTLCILLMIASTIGGVIFLYLGFSGYDYNVLFIILGFIIPIIAVVGFVLLIKKKLNPIIKETNLKIQDLKKKIDVQNDEASMQMASLNALYDWNIPAGLIEKTIPLIQMDKYFDAKKYAYLNKKYGLNPGDNNSSTTFVQSGSILGNPFLLCKDYNTYMGKKTYSNSIVIHWTTVVRDRNGVRTVHHTQTLTGYVTAPAPVYYYNTYLVYGSDAAPNLSFSREPSKVDGMDEKQIHRLVQRKAKQLDRKARRELMDNDPTTNYQRFGNDEFEVLFGGTDRDNEMEYRLLFTPLAQRNLIKLIKSNKPYGDDFEFVKMKCLNIVRTNHAQKTNYYANPAIFINNDYEKAKRIFINYNKNYFKSFYFDLAPLISIPLYQQHKSLEYIYEQDLLENLSPFEHEAIANSFDVNLLKHPESKTGNIYKTKHIRSFGNADEVEVTAYSYKTETRVTYVHKMGGDGKMHTIPVYWIEYLPVSQTTNVMIDKSNETRYNFNIMRNQGLDNLISRLGTGSYLFERGLFATILGQKHISQESIAELDKTFGAFEADVSKNSSLETLEWLKREIDKMNSHDQASGEASGSIDQSEATETSKDEEENLDINIEE